MSEIQRLAIVGSTRLDCHGSHVRHLDHLADKAAALEHQLYELSQKHKRALLAVRRLAEQTRIRVVSELQAEHALTLESLRRELTAEPDMLVEHSHYRLVGEPCRIHPDFIQSVSKVVALAEECDVKVHVTSSYRRLGAKVAGAIVEPADMSNHCVGHALDFNLWCGDEFFNSKRLHPEAVDRFAPLGVRQFIMGLRNDDTLRWGGDFTRADPVHIDDALNHRAPDEWRRKALALGGE